jgi:hypothetical protein
MCISLYPVSITTQFTRNLLGFGVLCQPDEICYSYLTVPQDISTQMIFNFQFTASKDDFNTYNVSVKLDSEEEDYYPICNRVHEIKDINRYHCFILLNHLNPGSTYNIHAKLKLKTHETGHHELFSEHNDNNETDVSYGNTLKFRTSDNNNVNFIQGGDISFTDIGNK